MIHRLSQRIADYCVEGTDADREIVAYGLECRISDLVQVAVLVAAGLLFRCAGEMLCFCICFTSLKRQVGGYHCATHFSCITTFSVLTVSVSKLVSYLPTEMAVPLTLACMVLVFGLVLRRAPVAHPSHPKSQAAHEKSRKTSIWIAAAGMVLLPLVSVRFPMQGAAGAMGGLLAALSLAVPVKKKGGRDG